MYRDIRNGLTEAIAFNQGKLNAKVTFRHRQRSNATHTVESLKSLLVPIAKEYGLNKLSVFGSVARGTSSPTSDVDLLVDVPKTWGLFAMGNLYDKIEGLLKCNVDIVTTGIEDKDFLLRIKKDEVVLYER